MPSYPTISCFCRYSAKTFTCIYKNTCTKMFAPRVLLMSALVCRDTITKYHRQGWSGLRSLKDSNFLSHSLAGLKARHQSVNLGPLPWVCSWLSSPCVLTMVPLGMSVSTFLPLIWRSVRWIRILINDRVYP